MKLLSKLFLCGLAVLFSQGVFSQTSKIELNNLFQQVDSMGAISTNISELRSLLLSDEQSYVIALPLPNGEFVNFKLIPDSVMAGALAIKYPNIRTFTGTSLNQPNDTGRFDITPNGFHGMFYYHGTRVFVEPNSVTVIEPSELAKDRMSKRYDGSSQEYKSYFSQGSRLTNKNAHTFHPPKKIQQQFLSSAHAKAGSANKVARTSATESAITTYRIAISTAAEYTQFHGGTVDSTMAELITLVNRLNLLYQRDLAIKLELVGSNDLLVYTDTNTDPFNNDGDDGDLNTSVINGVIGSTNYDIGHVVNTDGGGLAVLGGVCDSFYKGDGMTGSFNPTNDAFYIDYVAHEVGHQFGAEHTFNGTADACSGNRVANSAYEVGSGSTIMGYAGICDDQNLQSHSDDFFHAISIDQINDYTQNGVGSTCGTVTGELNNTAVVDAGVDYTIPAHTPFKLSGSASDIDSENLSYSWQQFDLGNESSSLAEQVDDGSRPLFRAFLPSSQTDRYFPKLSDVLNNITSIGESLPTTNRELNFRLMVLDNEGGASFDEVKLTVVDTGQAFALTSPTLNEIWTANNNTINWQVAGTNAAPINCASVNILLSKDGGENFEIILASGVTNNGSHEISLNSFCASDINTSQARIKLACGNNVFFAVNDGAFSIDKALSSTDISITSQQTFTVTQGDSITIASSQFGYACETPDSLTVQSGDNYTFSGTSITPSSDFTGILAVKIVANKNGITSESYTVNITVEEKPEPEPEPEPTPTEPETKSSGSISWLLLLGFILPWRVWQLTQSKNT